MPTRPTDASIVRRLRIAHAALDACAACPGVVGPVVHGPVLATSILLIGQAPGVHEGRAQRPFAWTAGRTLFRWFEAALGVDEASVRAHVYFAAVARCFPGKARGGGDRRPDADEIARCRPHLIREVTALQPRLILAVGGLAIDQVLGRHVPLADVVGTVQPVRYHGVATDLIALPHRSGVSSWHKLEPGRSLLQRALTQLGEHPEARRIFFAAREESTRAGP